MELGFLFTHSTPNSLLARGRVPVTVPAANRTIYKKVQALYHLEPEEPIYV